MFEEVVKHGNVGLPVNLVRSTFLGNVPNIYKNIHLSEEHRLVGYFATIVYVNILFL